MKRCPCGTQQRYMDCCGLYLHKKVLAPTPETLMRSRYSAYAENNMAYIKKTMKDPALARFTQHRSESKTANWLGLEILESSLHPTDAYIGYVSFIAKFIDSNGPSVIQEKSEFHFIDGAWYYVNGI